MKKLALGLGVAVVVVFVGGLVFEMAPGSPGTPPANAALQKGWLTHQDPLGFSVNLPPTWKVHTDPATGRIEFLGDPGTQVIVWPLFVPASLDPSSASSVLLRLATKIWPEAGWKAPQESGRSAVRTRGNDGKHACVAILTWATSPKGTAGYLYAMAAPFDSYQLSEGTFAEILKSFKIAGTPSVDPRSSVSYVEWKDPRENAFSLEVPAQWRVSGGTFRFASVDVRPALEAVSPDGQTRITGGDSQIPTFTEPTPYLQMAGFREGSWYSPGYGVNMMVRRYVPGAAFAREYVTSKVARGCADLTFLETRDRADLVQAINSLYAQLNTGGISTSWNAGEVSFSCRQGNQLMQGYYCAGILATRSPSGTQWSVNFLYGFLAPSEKRALTQSMLEHMLSTLQQNPQWASMQQNVTANTSQIVSRTNQEISKIVSDSYWSRQGVMDELSRRRSNATLGVEDVMDQTTGRQIKVESGSNYYWIDQHGAIVGTQTDTRPNLDFRELVRLP